MIAASEPQEFVPFGRQQLVQHPKLVTTTDKNLNNEATILNRLSQVYISNASSNKEAWLLRATHTDGVECEEEIYYKDKTVVWSVGPAAVDNCTNRVVKCCYTSETPVQQVVWCSFHLSPPDFPPTYFSTPSKPIKPLPNNEKDVKHLKNCIVVLNATVLKTFTTSGREYSTSLQFQVQKIWPVKYGLLLERKVNKETFVPPLVKKKATVTDLRRQSIEQSFLQKGSFNVGFPSFHSPLLSTTPELASSDLPTLFSLSHPLDEISPLASKSDYVSNPDLKIIFTCESPSLCFALDRKTGLHGVYLVRKALPHEAEACCRRETRPSRRNSYTGKSTSGNNSFSVDQDNRSFPAFLNARTKKSLGLAASTFANSPASSPFGIRTSSPLPSHPFPSFSPFSPASRKGESFHSSLAGTPSRIEHRMMSEDVEYAEAKPIFPQLCLECLWTEQSDLKGFGDSVPEASKAFLTADIMDQPYLCYLVGIKLNLLKIDVKSDEEFAVKDYAGSIHAKDACDIEARDMIAVISLDGGVDVYTGMTHVAKILISGVSSSVATPSYLSDAGPTFFAKPSPGTFPRRSSLIPRAQPLESPLFDETMSEFSPVTTCSDGLSPTLPVEREGSLIALKDNVGGRISLEYSSALVFRLELPHMGYSPLVESLLRALKQVLPASVAQNFLIKWFTTRNAPGCYNISLEEEFRMFTNLFYVSSGYDLELLQGNQQDQNSPVTKPKKLRTSELQSDEDWAALIGSQHHAMHSNRHSPFTLPAMMLRPKDLPPSTIHDTPMASSGRPSKSSEVTLTPVLTEKSKRVVGRKESLESIDETPVLQHAKPSFGKRIPSSRFKSFDKGGPSVVEEVISKENFSALRNKKTLLYPSLRKVFYAFHLLYEDFKLNTLRDSERELLVPVLYQLAKDLGCEAYVHHYWCDYPKLCRLVSVNPQQTKEDAFLTGRVPSIFRHLNDILRKKTDLQPYTFIPNVNLKSKNFIEVFGLMSYEKEKASVILANLVKNTEGESLWVDTELDAADSAHRVVLYLTKLGYTLNKLLTLPAGVVFALQEAFYRCRDSPGADWDFEAYRLAERFDLAALCPSPFERKNGVLISLTSHDVNPKKMETEGEDDGMEDFDDMDFVKLRWATDQRILELRRMLQSAYPVRIAITQRPEVSDHEFVQEQERYLYAVCARTMALPVGRGMVTLWTGCPLITEKLPIPQLCMSGKVPPSDKVVDMTHIEVPTNMADWPLFHNGVAAGLRIGADAPDIDSQWIIYNKPKGGLEDQIEHAGFLMALGFNGHLKNLVDLTIFMYLVKSHDMTRVGLLLGIAVSKRGTMDLQTVKMVSVHIEAMLPPTGIELDVDVVVEPAALMALGFLYQNTAQRHIAQVLLQEIGRPPGPEMENSVDRESYSLAAGLALGLVAFGQGDSLSGLADMTIPDTLHHLMVGGPKRPYLGSQRDKYKTQSFLIFEGPLVNTHVTGPGATLALGMLYFNTGNKAVVEWLKVPETQHLLERVLPDALLLRVLAKALIMWDEIDPSLDWVHDHIPEFVRPHCLVRPGEGDDTSCVDYETMNQAYCNIVAGACMAIGLRFAGSANEDAFETLSHFATKFTLLFNKSVAELIGRPTLETCLNVMTIALSMVMAGTGNIGVMRLVRYLRSRIGPSNAAVTYGSHLATHMALGLLFLGCGTLTLSTSREAVAALICAFYPKWPVCSSDNRYHLQALRHLYVLAVEPRIVLPRDIEMRTLCYVHLTYVYLDSSIYKGRSVNLIAPCLLPELNLLKEVRIEDDRYWPVKFTVGENWDVLKDLLAGKSPLNVRRRAGCLTYIEDPQGFRSLLAQALTTEEVIPWGVQIPEVYFCSSTHSMLECYLDVFFGTKQSDPESENERKTATAVSDFTYFCLTKDKLALLPIWFSLLRLLQKLSSHPNVESIWQWKLVFSQAECSKHSIIPADMALSVKQDILSLISSWEPGVLVQTKEYLSGNYESQELNEGRVTAFVTFNDIPLRGESSLRCLASGDFVTALTGLTSSGISPSAVLALISLL